MKELNEEQQASINKLIEKIEEDDDVQNVYHTAEYPDDFEPEA